MKTLILLWQLFVVEFCLAQTVVYTTGANGQTSAYLIVGNGTSSTSSSPSSLNPASSSTTSYNVTSAPSKTKIMLPTVPYTGQALLTGDCSIPMYTTLRYLDGHFLEIPLIGCSDDRPECCPSLSIASAMPTATSQDQSGSITSTDALTPTGVISLLNQAPLTVCPKDMTDLDPVCCPSGFTKWGTAILGNTPCASPLSTSYPIPSSALSSLTSAVAASTTVSAGAAEATQSVTIIVNVVFALGLRCADDKGQDEGLSTGAKAGIGVGVGVGVLLVIGLGIWLFTRTRRRRQMNKNKTVAAAAAANQTEKESTGFTSQTTEYPDKSKQQQQQQQHPNSGIWSPASGMSEAGFAGYGQGFVDGMRAALSPPPVHPQSPPPPFYGAPRTSLVHHMAEAPTEAVRHDRHDHRPVVQDEIPELSGTNEGASWNTRSSVG